MKRAGFVGIAIAALGAILLLARKKAAPPEGVPPEEVPPPILPTPPVGPDWAYSNLAGSVSGAYLAFGARITNNTSSIISRYVTCFMAVPSLPATWEVGSEAVTLGGGGTRWVDFSFQIWAAPPPGTTVEMWLEDDAGGMSDKLVLTV